MPSPLTRTSSILIIGGGTWGASTALHLARQGYQNVTVLDSYALPSAISAGNDVNKIKGWQNSDPASSSSSSSSGQGSNAEEYTREKIACEANQAWLQDEIFKPYYHETGYVIAASQPQHIQNLYEEEKPTAEKGFEELNSAQDFRNTMPEGVLTGDFPGWKGWFKREGCGWVHARKALVAALLEAERLGVKLVTGNPCGAVQSLWFDDDDDNDSDNDGNRNDVRGAITADGKHHLADRTILCAGANAPQLLDMKDQLRPTAWTLAHIQLTREESALYKNLPVLFNVERGFFMEPDEDKHQLKICDEHPGYCNWVTTTTDKNNKKISLPFPKNQIPLHSESNIRLFLHETMPHLANRPFTFARMCWCADTPNRDFLITRHPEYARLTLGVGASGHGYKYIPVIGKYIVQAMQEQLEPAMQYTWRWRPETAVGRDWEDVQGRMGGSYKVLNLAEIGDEEWTCIGGAEAKL